MFSSFAGDQSPSKLDGRPAVTVRSSMQTTPWRREGCAKGACDSRGAWTLDVTRGLQQHPGLPGLDGVAAEAAQRGQDRTHDEREEGAEPEAQKATGSRWALRRGVDDAEPERGERPHEQCRSQSTVAIQNNVPETREGDRKGESRAREKRSRRDPRARELQSGEQDR